MTNSFENTNAYLDWWLQDGRELEYQNSQQLGYSESQLEYQASLNASPHLSATSGNWAPLIDINSEYALEHVPSAPNPNTFLTHANLPLRPLGASDFHNTENNLHRSVSDSAASHRRAIQRRSLTPSPAMPQEGQAIPRRPLPPAPVIHQGSSATSTTIGIILLDEATQVTTLSCHFEQCSGRTFARLPELKRHYSEQHALYKPEYWCCVSGCPRSEQRGEKPFRRVDKCAEHERKQHYQMST